ISIILGIKLLKKDIKKIIITGGGRKNNFLMKTIANKLNKIKIINIDELGYNGDLLEAQMFAYLAVRSLKKLPLSTPYTTGVNESVTGGNLYSLIN
ncbi:anhydro-N-acetylmuramic acid kinase, partial [Alphaproteobacteria bacterium]|nr:anhydro-N-acetylmuramic acid kinase [Alphaproteobacteria bacterium]